MLPSRHVAFVLTVAVSLAASDGAAQLVSESVLSGRVRVGGEPLARGTVVVHQVNDLTQGEVDSTRVADDGSFAIRQGKWKLALCHGSGGWSPPWPGRFDINELPPEQLYDLESDIGESRNVASRFPEIVARLTDLLERYVENGRSTPGEAQKNARRVVLRKQGL